MDWFTGRSFHCRFHNVVWLRETIPCACTDVCRMRLRTPMHHTGKLGTHHLVNVHLQRGKDLTHRPFHQDSSNHPETLPARVHVFQSVHNQSKENQQQNEVSIPLHQQSYTFHITSARYLYLYHLLETNHKHNFSILTCAHFYQIQALIT